MSKSLAEVARRCDADIRRAREELIQAVRAAAASGMTQKQIAAEIGRSQPEVSRLLHFCGTSPLGRRLRKNASAIQKLVADVGGADVRVFGSVATGRDREGSDIDLIFTPSVPLSLMRLGRLEQDISHLVGVEVDLVPDSALKSHLRERVLAEAVAL
ncbi:MAG: toxin-antitoxin system toxin subunit [Actinobacteria bacterium HGW-Actinobacteria-2]|nr:MAG: toxin-antitoxin system toxin subunit [Actinobacteria bacterium HGW-Actinobacteria-2]